MFFFYHLSAASSQFRHIRKSIFTIFIAGFIIALCSPALSHIVTVDTTNEGAFLSMIVVNGNPAISYYDAANGDLKYVRANDAYGCAWNALVTVDVMGDVGAFASMTIVNGNPAISYYDATNDTLKYVQASNVDGSAWNAPLTVGTGGDDGMENCLAVVNGKPAISYYDAASGDLKYVQAGNADGSAWNAPVTVDGTANWAGDNSSLSVVNGMPAISYCDYTSKDIKYVQASNADGSVWKAPVIVADDDGVNTSLVVVNGKPSVGYYDAVSGNLKYVQAINTDGSSWNVPETIETGDCATCFWGNFMTLVNGKPAISYYNANNGDIKYIQASNADGSTWYAPVVLTNIESWSEFAFLTIVNGNPAVSFYDVVSGVKYVRALDINGTYWSAPTGQASAVGFTGVAESQMTVNWTRGNGEYCIVLLKSGAAVDSNPVDNVTYNADSSFGAGSQIGSGNHAVYKGSGSSVTITGLAGNTTYHVAVYEFNGTGGNEEYLTAVPAVGSKSTSLSPVMVTADGQTIVSQQPYINTGTFSNITVDPGVTVDNSGTLNDLTNSGTVTGGTVSGESDNQGVFQDVTLSANTRLDNLDGTVSGGVNQGNIFGGTLQGTITNSGTISGTMPDGTANPAYGVTIENSAVITGGQVTGTVINNGTLGNMTLIDPIQITFGHSGQLTGTITVELADGSDFVIVIPAGAVFPDQAGSGADGFTLTPQSLSTYAQLNRWMASSTRSIKGLSKGSRRTAQELTSIPDGYILVQGLVLSETGEKASEAFTISIAYEEADIPERYTSQDLKALVYDPETRTWEPASFVLTNGGTMDITTDNISSYAAVVPETVPATATSGDSGGGCFIAMSVSAF
jgi:hypothetical protein